MRSEVSLYLLNILLLSLLVIALLAGIPKVESQFYDYYYPDVTFDVYDLTTYKNIKSTLSFKFFSAPPGVEEFGLLIRNENTFSVNITIHVPAPWEAVLLVVHTDSYTYNLGNLSQGVYNFEVYVHHTHYTEGTSYLGAKITFLVTPVNIIWNIGDINGDRRVTIADIILACEAYDSTPEESHWDPLVDVAPLWNRIDIYDLATIAYHYGEEYTP